MRASRKSPASRASRHSTSLTPVTDAGLEEIKGLKILTGRNLFDTKVTDAGHNELKKVRPNCTGEK